MRFWDSSAVVSLMVRERQSGWMRSVLDEDPEMIVWWGTPLECVSALCRRERERPSLGPLVQEALGKLEQLQRRWYVVTPTETVLQTATRMLRVHPLRAADALQLAAAFTAAEGLPASLEMVSLDARLVHASRKEGFRQIPGAEKL